MEAYSRLAGNVARVSGSLAAHARRRVATRINYNYEGQLAVVTCRRIIR